MALLLIATTCVAIYGHIEMNTNRSVMMRLYQLKSDILLANLALRNAAVTVTDAQMEVELGKMLTTRSSANETYDYLMAADLSKVDRVIVNEMKNERVEYREAQLKVISLIRKHKDEEAWDALAYYQTLMDRYVSRVDRLITDIVKCSKNTYSKVIATALASLVVSILIGACAIRRLFWGPQ
jgi:hypothetical protein